MLGSLMMLASGLVASWPSSVSSSLIRCAGVSFSGKLARIRPAKEVHFTFMDTPAAPTKASTIGSREKVASAGASSTFVHMISEFGMLAPLLAVLVWADRKLTIGGPGEGISLGALMNCTRRGGRQPGIRLDGNSARAL